MTSTPSIAANKVVTLQFEVTDHKTNEVIDTSAGGEPMVYLHGAGNIIPGLEEALIGKVVGDSVEVVIEPDQAYGQHSPERVQQVPRDVFQGIENLQVGALLDAQTESGPLTLCVVALDDETVTVDANHPLAGKSLKFNISVEAIRDASAEEQAHGHVHGPGGVHH